MAFNQWNRTENERLKFTQDDNGNTVIRVILVV